jgi:hypothetical protein
MSGTWKIRNSDLHDVDLAVKETPLHNSSFGYWVYARDQHNINRKEEKRAIILKLVSKRLPAANPR